MLHQNPTPFRITNLEEFLKLVEEGSCPEGSHLDLSHSVFKGTTYALKISEALMSGQCPQGLQINLDSCNFGAAGMIYIMKALKSGKCPQGLQLYLASNLADHDTSGNSAKNFIEVLKSDQCPQGLQIDISKNFRDTNSINSIAQAMLTNTSVVELKLQDFPQNENDLITIKHCCLRNRLLHKYPELESYIKEISYKAGMYSPGKLTTPLPLKTQVASFIVANKKINTSQLPQDLIEYVGILDEINQLKSSASFQQKK